MDMVAHACNLSYLGGRVGRSWSRADQAKPRSYLKNKLKPKGESAFLVIARL
jgi:hypothetical protein